MHLNQLIQTAADCYLVPYVVTVQSHYNLRDRMITVTNNEDHEVEKVS